MIWEDLIVYRPLHNEELKTAKKDLTNLISSRFADDGFVLKQRKLYRLSLDLFHVIDIDTRGNWMGSNEYFKINVSVCSVYDTDTLVNGYDDPISLRLEELLPGIRNHDRITQEYPLLADYLSEKIRESVLPYFLHFKSSTDVLKQLERIKLNRDPHSFEWNDNLILFSELANKINSKSREILEKKLSWYNQSEANEPAIQETKLLLKLVNDNKWADIEAMLLKKKAMVFYQLKWN